MMLRPLAVPATRRPARHLVVLVLVLGFGLVAPSAAIAAFTAAITNADNSFATATSFNTYPQSITTTTSTQTSGALVFYHRFNETSGTTAADSSGNSRAGTYNGTASAQMNTTGATGDGNAALKLGSGNWASASGSSSITGNVTLEVWFKTTGTSIAGPLMGLASTNNTAGDGNPRFLLALNSNGFLCAGAFFNSSTQRVCSTTGKPSADAWHHGVAVFNNTGGTSIYLDCASSTCTPLATNADLKGWGSFSPSGHWRVGEMAISSNFNLGYSGTKSSVPALDEGGIYTAALSTTQISNHFSAASGTGYASTVKGDSPFLYWRLADTDPSTLSDDSGSNRAGAYYGYTAGDYTLGVAGALLGTQKTGNTAVTLNGTKNIDNAFSVDAAGPFTTEAWIRTSSTTGGMVFNIGSARTGNSTTVGPGVYFTDTGKVVFAVSDTQYLITTTSYNDGAWHHIGATIGSTGMRLYLNGSPVQTSTTPTSAPSYTGHWRWGGDAIPSGWPNIPTTTYLKGTFDEASVYNKQLSDQDVMLHYAANSANR